MRIFFLISAIIVGIIILISSFAQLGATCTWYLFNATTPAFIVLLQMSTLGAIMGGLLVLFWKTQPPNEDDDEVNVRSED